MSHFDQDFLPFFRELGANNHKDWFDQNRDRYAQIVREPFKDFVRKVIDKVKEIDPAFDGLEPKDCIFRINRDIRFSKDKTPYKTQVSAVVAPEGKKSRAINGVYFEFSPEHVRIYGGIYDLDKDSLLFVREGIADNLEKFRKLYSNKSFKSTFGEILGEKNKIIPKHLKEAATQEPLIFNKQWYFYRELPAEDVYRDDLLEVIIESYKVARPIEQYLNKLMN